MILGEFPWSPNLLGNLILGEFPWVINWLVNLILGDYCCVLLGFLIIDLNSFYKRSKSLVDMYGLMIKVDL